jgi:hypothetical protein
MRRYLTRKEFRSGFYCRAGRVRAGSGRAGSAWQGTVSLISRKLVLAVRSGKPVAPEANMSPSAA